jgi:hypothetical protein
MLGKVLISTLSHAVMITVFVLFMMVIIEYINIQSRNLWSEKLRKSPFMQIFIAAILGIIPGCLGAFTVVSLYTHRMMGLPALVAVMIATSGDEAFVMFALFPGKALLLHAVLFVIAMMAGLLVQVSSKYRGEPEQHGFLVHDHEHCRCFSGKIIIPQLLKLTFERAVLLLLSSVFVILLHTGVIGPPEWNWIKITYMAGSLFMLFVFLTVPEHFLKEHLYQHILKRHLLRIFLWTWGAFIVLHFVESSLTLTNLVQDQPYLILILAVLLGVIPESGPHLVFVTMFSENLIPFSVLLANSIVQDGHGMLPLLAESGKDFVKVKAINLGIGFMVGLILLILGL